MNDALLRSLLALALVSVIVLVSALILRRERTSGSRLQLIGAGFLVAVVVVHIFEALAVFPRMGWGRPDSIGHYIDLASGLIGLFLLVFGFILGRFQHARHPPFLR